MYRFSKDSAQPTDFAVDTSLKTVWTSESGKSPVTFYVGLSNSTVLYKIFVTFSAPSYQSAILEFMNPSDNTPSWRTLQQYAMDCTQAFGVPPDGQ